MGYIEIIFKIYTLCELLNLKEHTEKKTKLSRINTVF